MTGSRTLASLLSLVVLLGVVAPTLGGCNETQRKQREYSKAERLRKKAMKDVGVRAHEYLLAVRWRDFQEASDFYEKIPDQVSFLQRMTDPRSHHPVVETFEVDYVLVDEGSSRAEVRVSLSEVDHLTQRLRSRDETLLWYRSEESKPKEWYLVPVVVIEP
jgi:hypothetical protein